MRLYLDASPVIYLVEQRAPYAALVLTQIRVPGTILVSSDLVLMEALVQPLRHQNQPLVQDFNNFFAIQVAERIPFCEAVFRQAADIRARYNFRTPDALHLAAALYGTCDMFLTNDANLASFPNIHVEVVS